MDALLAATLLNLVWSMAHASVFIGAPLAILAVGGGAWLLGLAALGYDASYILLSPLAGRLGDIGYRRRLVAVSALVEAAASLTMLASLRLHEPLLAVAAKLMLGVAGGLAVPNTTALIVDHGVGRGKRPEELLARYYGSSSTAGWLAGYLLGGLVSRHSGLEAVALLGLAASLASIGAAAATPRPPVTLEHSVAVSRARVRLHHERPMRGLYPRAKLLIERLSRSPLLPFYAAVATGFTGIALFFSMIPDYWVEVRHLSYSDVMVYASIHTLVSTLAFLAVHRLVERLGAAESLALAFAARSLVFYEPLATEKLLPPGPQAALTYTLTGLTWALLNTSLNTLALSLRVGGRGARLGLAQSASSLGLVAGDAASMLVSYTLGVRACLAAAAALEAVAALLAYRLRVLTRPAAAATARQPQASALHAGRR